MNNYQIEVKFMDKPKDIIFLRAADNIAAFNEVLKRESGVKEIKILNVGRVRKNEV